MSKRTDIGELKPTTSTFKWKVKNFSTTCSNMNAGDCLCSPVFQASHLNTITKWSLKLYPKGEKEHYRDYVALFIGYYGEADVDSAVTLSLLDNKNNKIICETMSEKLFYHGKSRGYPKFINRRHITNGSSNILDNDTLNIFCEITYDTQIPVSKKKASEQESNEYENEPNYKKELDDFEKLLVTEHLSDVTFVIGANKIHLHKAILASRSPVFYAMFEHEMKEKQESVVVITDIKYEVMRELARFIYASRVNEIEKYSRDLLVAAEKYSISGLKDLCEVALYNNLKISNAIEYLSLAGACNCILLKLQVTEFIASNQHIVKAPEFLDPELMCEVTRAIVEKNLEQ